MILTKAKEYLHSFPNSYLSGGNIHVKVEIFVFLSASVCLDPHSVF